MGKSFYLLVQLLKGIPQSLDASSLEVLIFYFIIRNVVSSGYFADVLSDQEVALSLVNFSENVLVLPDAFSASTELTP